MRNKSFEFENLFFQHCSPDRISKFLIQFELFSKVKNLRGEICELGIFKGNSFIRLAIFRKILNKKNFLIGFDTFGNFPKAHNKSDHLLRKKFIQEAGSKSISTKELKKILKRKNCLKKIKLVKGDVLKTLPIFLKKNKNIKISLINLDLDLYEPSKMALDLLFPKLVNKGIIILDNFNNFFGETKAVKEFCKKKFLKVKNEIILNKKIYYIQK
jgi:hypothetical protein